MVLCNPHNPLGKVFPREDLRRIASLAEAHGVTVFSDEIFGEISFDGHEVVPYLRVGPDHGILCTSLGKVFNLTGVNHANVVIRSPALRERFLAQRHQDHFGSIDPFFYTALLAGYSPEGLAWVNAMKAYVWGNYQWIRGFLLDHMPRIGLCPLEGGFIVWIDFRNLGLGAKGLRAFLENKALMFLDQGGDYGPQGEGFCRMNIASPRSCIERSLESLRAAYAACGF